MFVKLSPCTQPAGGLSGNPEYNQQSTLQNLKCICSNYKMYLSGNPAENQQSTLQNLKCICSNYKMYFSGIPGDNQQSTLQGTSEHDIHPLHVHKCYSIHTILSLSHCIMCAFLNRDNVTQVTGQWEETWEAYG